MLRILTIAEAIAFLSKETGHEWTDSELFDLAVYRGISFNAAVPITIATTIRVFEVGAPDLVEKMRLPAGHSILAVLFSFQVAQLWLCGETTTVHPLDHDEIEGEYKFLTEPIRVTRADVRIRAGSLLKILAIWREAEQIKLPGKVAALQSADAIAQTETPSSGAVFDSPVERSDTAPAKWSRGMKGIAWQVAQELVSGGNAITGPALWEGMVAHGGAAVSGNVIRFKAADAKLSSGETEVMASTVKKDWCGQLKKVFTGTA